MPKENEIRFKVRYSETDAQGVVHHSNYARYFEDGRIAWLADRGSDYREFEKNGFFLVVVDLRIHFLRPAKFGDELHLKTTLTETTRVRMTHAYELKKAEELLTTAETIVACVDAAGKPQRFPASLAGAC